MDLASQALEVLGLLAVLSSISIIFIQLLKWLFGKRDNQVKIGAQLLLSFSVIYIAAEYSLGLLELSEYGLEFKQVAALFWWLSLAFIIDSGTRKFVWQGLMADHGVSHVPKLVRDLISLLTYAAAIMIVMHFVYDEPIGAVLATSGGIAFIIGFAGQKTLAEAFAGLSLSLSKTFRVGDFLEVNGVYGQVHEMNWRSVSLLNPHTGSLYVFPNSAVAGSTVLNYCAPTERFKNTVSFKVEMHAPPELVMRSVLEELKNSRSVFQDPKPDIHVLEFNDYGLTYRIRYFFDGDDPWWDAQNEVVNAIWNAMKRHGFRFAVNRNHLMSGVEWDLPSDPNRQVLSNTEIAALLQQHSLFENTAEPQLIKIAEEAVRCEWLPPETIYNQGEPADELVLIADGVCDVYLSDNEGEYLTGTVKTASVMGIPCIVDGARKYNETLQAQQFCIGYKISLEKLVKILEADSFEKTLTRHCDESQQLLETQLQEAKRLFSEQLHSENHSKLTLSLKSKFSDYYRNDLVSHLLNSIVPHPNEKKLLDALAGTAALIVSDDKNLSDKEAAFFCDMVEHIGSLKHIEHSQVVTAFENYFNEAVHQPDQIKAKVLSKLGGLAEDDLAKHLIIDACKAMAGIHGHHSERQKALLEEFSIALKIECESPPV
ncbi:MAG: mechanosensitive ion channel domain-containing protein [Neptuniibacter sp.]